MNPDKFKGNQQPIANHIHAASLNRKNRECPKKKKKELGQFALITSLIYSFIQQGKNSLCQGSRRAALKCKQYLH